MQLRYNTNVFFFKDAANQYESIEAYTEELIKICGSEEKLYQALAEQIHAESVIIEGKFNNVKRSITFFAISFLCGIITAIYWIIFT